MSAGFEARVLVAEDEEFTLNLLREVLTSANFLVQAVTNVSDAIAKIGSFDPHAVITDLNFGISGPSGVDLLQYIEKEHPWVGKVVLTSHASPALAVPNRMVLPAGVTYLEPNMRQVKALDTVHETPITEPVAEQSRD